MIESLMVRMARFAVNNSPVRLDYRRNRHFRKDDRAYRDKFVGKVEGRVVDIGSGSCFYPGASVLVDKYPGETPHRNTPLETGGRVFIQADIEDMPFKDKEFDYSVCSHVLEHVIDPIKACNELTRISRAGYIETPRIGTDTLFSWDTPVGIHRWLIHSQGDTLFFFSNTERLRMGIKSTAWRDVLSMIWHHPLQDAYYNNLDVFNVMFKWQGSFKVIVFYSDGTRGEI